MLLKDSRHAVLYVESVQVAIRKLLAYVLDAKKPKAIVIP